MKALLRLCGGSAGAARLCCGEGEREQARDRGAGATEGGACGDA